MHRRSGLWWHKTRQILRVPAGELAPPVVADTITTEDGEALTTEGSIEITTEAA